MNAIRVETVIDEATAHAVPQLRPLLGQRVELIALQMNGSTSPGCADEITIDELVAARLTPPLGTPGVSLDDMERAIGKGASRGID